MSTISLWGLKDILCRVERSFSAQEGLHLEVGRTSTKNKRRKQEIKGERKERKDDRTKENKKGTSENMCRNMTIIFPIRI
jgi:hypothetical protein